MLMLRPENVATPPTAATVVVPESVPPPGFAPSATVTLPVKPVAVFPCPSSAVTCTAGVIAAPATVLLGCTVRLSCVAAPAVIVMTVELTPVRPGAEKLSVRSPAVPLIARFVNDATPVPIVVAVRVPPNVPPPAAIAAVTVTPAWLTGLFAPSRTCTAGCWAKATPLWADAEG